MKLNDLVEECFYASRDRGWWIGFETNRSITGNNNHLIIGTKFALIHSEISEAMEAYRTNTPDTHLPNFPGINIELADACIRIFDLAGRLGIDLELAIEAKMNYNKERLDHNLDIRSSKHGKKF